VNEEPGSVFALETSTWEAKSQMPMTAAKASAGGQMSCASLRRRATRGRETAPVSVPSTAGAPRNSVFFIGKVGYVYSQIATEGTGAGRRGIAAGFAVRLTKNRNRSTVGALTTNPGSPPWG
jgi:hypothetical protein